MSDNIHSQYDFFKAVQLDADGNLLVSIVNGGSGTSANYYTTGATLTGTILTFDRNDLLAAYSVNLSGITASGSGVNYYTTAATITNDIVYFDRTDTLSAYTLSLTGYATNDIYVTGGTVSGTNLTLTRNDNVNVLITGFSTDIHTTGSTLIGNVAYFNTTDTLSAYTLDLTSLAPSGGTDNYTTGSTLVGDIAYFDRTDTLSAYTLNLSSINVTGVYLPLSGGTLTGGLSGTSLNLSSIGSGTSVINLGLDSSGRVVTGTTSNGNVDGGTAASITLDLNIDGGNA